MKMLESPILPVNEAERLAALRRHEIVDTPADKSHDDIARLAAQMVRDSEERRLFALESAGVCDWDMDLRTGKVTRSSLHDRLFGYPEPLSQWNSDIFFAHVHPEDREQVARCISSKGAQPGKQYDIEFRTAWPDGSIHWLWAKGRFYFDEWKNPVRLSGILMDITQHREREQKIARLALVVEKITTGVMILDKNGNIEWANPAVSALTGYELSETIGHSPGRMMQGPDTNPLTLQKMEDAIRNQRGFELELLSYHKSGHPFWQHIKANPVLQQHGEAESEVESYITLHSDITERKQFDVLLWNKANYDTLTGLPNRRLFWDRLDHEIRHAHRAGRMATLYFIDLDRFKEINDLYGHDMGDKVIREVTARINACVRDIDTVARIGGDEFTVILADLDDVTYTQRIAHQILKALSTPFQFDKATINISGSIGIALYPNDADTSENMMRHADQAMYMAKSGGRNQIRYFTYLMQEQLQRRLHIGLELRQALSRGQLQVHFQPVVSMLTGQIVKAEALLRWQHPESGMITPSEFIPIAEELGLIDDIGEWIFQEAAYYAEKWSTDGDRPFQISVNKSPAQFSSRAKEESWPSMLETMGLPASRISVEITEGILLKDSKIVMDTLREYRAAGIEIALDDFGTGYSSMAYLSKFSIDYLKIDQSFVQDITNPHNRTIAETIILMGHKLGLKIIAEGIETIEQRNVLAEAGCDYGQGFLFSKAVPPEEFERMLHADSSRRASIFTHGRCAAHPCPES